MSTVTSNRNGEVYKVIAWPADAEAEDMAGRLWVKSVDGAEFSIRERQVTEGGDYDAAAAAWQAAHTARDLAAWQAREAAEMEKVYAGRTWEWTAPRSVDGH